MSALFEMIAGGKRISAHPWPRAIITRNAWEFAGRQLVNRAWTLVAMWAEPAQVHLALLDLAFGEFGIISLDVQDGRFPSIGVHHSPARRLERTIHDLYGLIPEGAPDLRRWLDHGKWHVHAPLGAAISPSAAEPYTFLPVDGEGLHQIPVGPVHAGIIEPGHFRFTASGETVVRLEERLGYVHKGIESLLIGASLERATQLAARASGDTTVAYSTAFAQAVEAANSIIVPSRAAWLRALMLELERLANHFGDVGAICNDAAFSLMHAHCAVLRELVLRVADGAFGHRLMMDRVVPGGVTADLDQAGQELIVRLQHDVRHRFSALVTLYEDTASLQDRTVGTGVVAADNVRHFGAGGFVGRASGRDFDARRVFPQPPYDALHFKVATRQVGDVDARIWVRIQEIEQSLSIIGQILAQLPEGILRVPLSQRGGEGAAMVEGFRGDIFVWVRMNGDGSVARAHLRDPSWFQWPLLEAAVENNIVADFPLCNKSFNCSYAGHDL